jgi:hypothetical protein
MSATYEVHEGCTTLISDEGYRRLADEQRIAKLEPIYDGVRFVGLAGSVIALAGLVIKQLVGS